MSHRGPKRSRPASGPARVHDLVTHEPAEPQNWPEGHVSVDLTEDHVTECVEISIHGVKHLLHATTARELTNMLTARLDEWNKTATTFGAEPV